MSSANTYDGRTRGPCASCSGPMTRVDVARRRTAVLPCGHRLHAACVPAGDDAACPACLAPFDARSEDGDPYELGAVIRRALAAAPPEPGAERELELLGLDAVLERGRTTAIRVALARGPEARRPGVSCAVVLVSPRTGLARYWLGRNRRYKRAERVVPALSRDWRATAAAVSSAVRELVEEAICERSSYL